MRVSKNDTICGLAAPAARQLTRAYFDDRPVEVACDILGVSQDAARDQMRAFEAAGYVERGGLAHAAGDDWWATTVKGNALANASFGKPISRATATRLLGQVIERARAYNADPARLLTVTEIVVFGSYLDPAVDLLGDLDLAVSTARRDTDGQRYVDKVLEYARASGRSFSAFHDRLFWPARELRMTYLFSAIAVVILPLRKPDLWYASAASKIKVLGVPVVPVAGVITIALLVYNLYEWLSNGAYGVNHKGSLVYMGAMYVLAIVIYGGARIIRNRQGIDLGLINKEIPVE